jgi:hypothetical protein
VTRFLAAFAIFCGWLSIPIGAVAGVIVSQFFDIGRVDGGTPPTDVYGVSGIMVFWVYACVTVTTALPLIAAMVAVDPRRPLQIMAAVMGVLGIAMLPSELGRAFGLPIVAGGVCLWIGADLAHRSGDLSESFERVAAAEGGADLAQGTGAGAAGGIATVDRATAAALQPGVPPSLSEPASGASARPPGGIGGSIESGAGGKRRGRGGRPPAAVTRTCPWCSTVVPAADQECPKCGAALALPAADEVAIPGLTEVPPELRRYAADARSGKGRPSILKMIFSDTPVPTAVNVQPPSDPEALRPPSVALRAEMARLDAEIAAGVPPVDPGSAETADTAAAGSTTAASTNEQATAAAPTEPAQTGPEPGT